MAAGIRLSAKRKASEAPGGPPGPAQPPPAKRVVLQAPGGWEDSPPGPEGLKAGLNAAIGGIGGGIGADRTSLLSLFTDCMSALSANKICSRNAFEIGIIDHIDDLVALRNEEAQGADVSDVCFSTASRVVEGASRVYGYRVEAVYDKTFNVLMNIQTTEKEQRRVRASRRRAHEFSGTNTLLPEGEVTLAELPVEPVLMDPFFLRVSSLFDQSGPQGLLLVNLLVDGNLELSLSSFGAPCAPKGGDGGPMGAEGAASGPEGPESPAPEAEINHSLLAQLAGDFAHLEILPELDVYLETSEMPSLPAATPPSAGPPGAEGQIDSLGDLAPLDSLGDPSPIGDSMGPLSPTGDSIGGLTDSLGGDEFYDALEFDAGLDTEALADTEAERSVLSRVAAIDTGQDLSYYGANAPTAPAPLPKPRRKQRERAPRPPPQSAEHFILASDLNEVLDSIELVAAPGPPGPDRGFSGALAPVCGGLGPEQIAQMAQRVHSCPPLPWPLAERGPDPDDWASASVPDDWPLASGQDEWPSPSGPDDPDSPEAAGSAFVDVAFLKGAIMDYVMQRSPTGPSTPSGGVSFVDLIDHVRRRVSRTVGVHIVFVCLLHVCNEASLRLAQPEPDDFLISVDNV